MINPKQSRKKKGVKKDGTNRKQVALNKIVVYFGGRYQKT
jgi:hypothetical protein